MLRMDTKQELQRILDELRKPFHPSHVSWKPGAVKGERALALAYADLRAYMNRLDEVCGTDWSVTYDPWGEDRIICRLTIMDLQRSSIGESDKESERSEIGGTVAEAQAFKRAAAMFGLGRYLYNLPTGWADYDPATKKFTDKAKAKLTGILVQHYRRANDGKSELADIVNGNVSDEPAAGEFVENGQADTGNPSHDPTPYYVRDWHKLAGKEYDLVKWVRTLHKASDGPATVKQYQYLSGVIDGLTDGNHSYALTLLCQTEISKANMPGGKVATNLLELLVPTTKQDDGTVVDSPAYRADIAEMITRIVKQLAPVAA